ncbi:hypothetical protein DXZ75_30960 [Streptomyces sp. AcE210]|nr:hypothetical protein DXZ75_30960 [Streptomyces sp. AcE210]
MVCFLEGALVCLRGFGGLACAGAEVGRRQPVEGAGLLLSAYSSMCRRAASAPLRRYRRVRGSEARETSARRTRFS